MREHRAIRPGWTCLGCGALWPCETRRADLREEFTSNRLSLSMLMAGYFVEAMDDRPRSNDDLYAQFMGWLRRA